MLLEVARSGDASAPAAETAPAPDAAARRPEGAEHRGGVPRTLFTLSEFSWRSLVCVAAIGLLAYGLWQLRFVMLPVFGALLIATLLTPPSRALRRTGLPPGASTAVVFVIALLALTIVAGGLVPPIVDQFDDVGRQVRGGIDELVGRVASGPFGVSEREVQVAIDDAAQRLGERSGAVVSGVLNGAIIAGQLLAQILLTVVLAFFFVKDGPRLWDRLVDLFPRRRRQAVREVGASGWRILSAYVRGMALVGLVDAILIGLALALLGVPLALPLAALTFVSAFVPLIGAVVAGGAAALVALVAVGPLTAVLVVAAVVVVQQVEGNLLYPVVVGRAMKLHPVVILLAVTTGAVVAGIIGALVAVPAAAVIGAAVPIVREARATPVGEPLPLSAGRPGAR